MKHKQFGFLHLICGKQGKKGRRKLAVEVDFGNDKEGYSLGITFRLIFFFVGAFIDIEKKQELIFYEKIVSQETTDDDSV